MMNIFKKEPISMCSIYFIKNGTVLLNTCKMIAAFLTTFLKFYFFLL